VPESTVVSELVGSESESESGSPAEASPALDPTAAAIAVDAAKIDPVLAQKAAEYFDKQTHLVEIQTEHLHEQRAINLKLLKLRNIADRIRITLQVAVLLLAVAIVILAGTVLADAIGSRKVVVEAFDAPPDLTARGLTGKVVASALLDELTELQAASHISNDQKRQLSSAWSNEVELALPEAGISLNGVAQFLRNRFGHDLKVGGDLVETSKGAL